MEQSMLSPRVRRGSCRDSQSDSVSEELELDDGSSLADGVAYLSLCASGTTDTNHEPYYVGSSSGAAIARVIQSSIYRGSASKPTTTPLAPSSQINSSSGVPRPTTPTSPSGSNQSIFELPAREQARMLFDFFFERIHPRWPLLDREVYEKLFADQYMAGRLSITERSILHMIYAITARFLAVTRKPCGIDDEVVFSTNVPPVS